jgi:hypothetical protein
MIIGTQDKQNMYNVVVQSTLPLYPSSKAKKKKKGNKKRQCEKKNQERKENE